MSVLAISTVIQHPTAITRHRMKSNMKAFRVVFRLGLLIGLGIEISGLPTFGQTTPRKESQPPAAELRKLTSADAKRAAGLEKAIEAALEADRWDEAIAKDRGTARLADADPGAEALRDRERRVAPQDIAPRGPDAARGSSRLPVGQYRERCKRKPSIAQTKYAEAQPLLRRHWRSAVACSPTTTPTPPRATTTWRPTSTPRGSTPRPSR